MVEKFKSILNQKVTTHGHMQRGMAKHVGFK